MATDAQIKAESWWQREQVSPELKAFGVRLRGHFDVSAGAFGTVGNTAHLVGRHRSLEWNINSRFATRRNYGTRDKRDLDGNHRLIRAFDLSLPRAVLFEVSQRLEAAVADGRAYMLAEWYGDLGDDNTVDGWFEGHDSTSDPSHKEHAHGGLWTIYADDEQALNDLFDIMTEDDMADLDYGSSTWKKANEKAVGSRPARLLLDELWMEIHGGYDGAYDTTPAERGGMMGRLDRIETALTELKARPAADVDEAALAVALAPLIVAGATPAEVAAAVRAELDKTRLGGS